MEYTVTIGNPPVGDYKKVSSFVRYNTNLTVEKVKHLLEKSVKEAVTEWIGPDDTSYITFTVNEADKLVVVELCVTDGSTKDDIDKFLWGICEILWLDVLYP